MMLHSSHISIREVYSGTVESNHSFVILSLYLDDDDNGCDDDDDDDDDDNYLQLHHHYTINVIIIIIISLLLLSLQIESYSCIHWMCIEVQYSTLIRLIHGCT